MGLFGILGVFGVFGGGSPAVTGLPMLGNANAPYIPRDFWHEYP